MSNETPNSATTKSDDATANDDSSILHSGSFTHNAEVTTTVQSNFQFHAISEDQLQALENIDKMNVTGGLRMFGGATIGLLALGIYVVFRLFWGKASEIPPFDIVQSVLLVIYASISGTLIWVKRKDKSTTTSIFDRIRGVTPGENNGEDEKVKEE